jgi:hypothetical protein
MIQTAFKIVTGLSSLFRKNKKPCQILKWNDQVIALPHPTPHCELTHRVFLLCPGNVQLDITQPAGTSYKYLPSELGGTEFLVTDSRGNESTINDYISINNKLVRRRLDE